jgi:hypothetical protein
MYVFDACYSSAVVRRVATKPRQCADLFNLYSLSQSMHNGITHNMIESAADCCHKAAEPTLVKLL